MATARIWITRSCTCSPGRSPCRRASTWTRASGSAVSATPATQSATTCTSRSGREPGGRRAASRSTRCPTCSSGRRGRLYALFDDRQLEVTVKAAAADAQPAGQVAERRNGERREQACCALQPARQEPAGEVARVQAERRRSIRARHRVRGLREEIRRPVRLACSHKRLAEHPEDRGLAVGLRECVEVLARRRGGYA